MTLFSLSKHRFGRFIVLGLVFMLLICTACGGGDSTSGDADDPSQPESAEGGSKDDVPTMPAASFGQPTTMIDATKVAVDEDVTPEPKAVDPEQGGQIYSKLCAECHGEGLAGVSGKAEVIDEYTLDGAALTDLLRTGGGFGPEHLFGLDKVSPEGIASLQVYLETIE